jgi:hypothetical protein
MNKIICLNQKNIRGRIAESLLSWHPLWQQQFSASCYKKGTGRDVCNIRREYCETAY